MTGLSDGALLRATVQGDADAYATLFRRHVSAVTGFALRRVRNAHEAADLVGETFLIALEAAPRYREELPSALPWLLGIARRLWMSQMRRDHRLDRLRSRVGGSMPRFEAAEEDDVVEAIDAARQRPEIEAALERLSCGERDVLELVALHGLSPQEAALALDVSANAARLRLSRARRRMRSMIDGEHPAVDWTAMEAELA
jgi:RNA polymerase sigma-70 factor (ECF subfamily)